MATKRAPRPPTERIQWIIDNAHLSPKEALAAIRQRWPKASLQSIYAMRNTARRHGIKIPKSPTATPAKHPERHGDAPRVAAQAPTRKPVQRALSRSSEFIISLPLTMRSLEVVERAQKAGLTLTRAQVDAARSRYRKALAKGGAAVAPEATELAPAPEPTALARKPRKGQPEATVLPLGQLTTDEADFFGIVLGIGWNRASRLMAQFRVQFFDMIKAHTTEE